MDASRIERLGPPIDVRPLLGPERAALVELLAHLSEEDWGLGTVAGDWTVHDLALHLIHDDLRRLSSERDGHRGEEFGAVSLDDLVIGLDESNRRWVSAVRRAISPRVATELLAWLAGPSERHLSSLDPAALDGVVSWAGEGPHPNWLDVAREYTERWTHQQQIRFAVGRPGLGDPTFLEPVLDTFARALPSQLPMSAPAGHVAQLRTRGSVDRKWTFLHDDEGWMWTADAAATATFLETTPDLLWKRAVRMATRDELASASRVGGDEAVTRALLDIRAAIVSDHEP